MSDEKKETIADIVAEMRRIKYNGEDCTVKWCLTFWADRIEAAEKRMVDSIHRAMVIIAGIEMENSDYQHRLWTALEDAYDALSDALGTDGETTADEEEAKATGRHFVVKSYGNAEAMREALNEIQLVCYKAGITIGYDVACGIIKSKSRAARSDPPRNCDVGTVDEQLKRFSAFCMSRKCNECPFVSSTYGECGVRWSQMSYEEGGAE